MNIIDTNIKLENQLDEAIRLLTQSVELAKTLYSMQAKSDQDYQTLQFAYNALLRDFEKVRG